MSETQNEYNKKFLSKLMTSNLSCFQNNTNNQQKLMKADVDMTEEEIDIS